MTVYYRAIITYTISNDDLREEFMEFIEEIGFLPQDDQSTYALPKRRIPTNKISDSLQKFCDEKLKKGDYVDYYWAAYQHNEFVGIGLTKYKPKK